MVVGGWLLSMDLTISLKNGYNITLKKTSQHANGDVFSPPVPVVSFPLSSLRAYVQLHLLGKNLHFTEYL